LLKKDVDASTEYKNFESVIYNVAEDEGIEPSTPSWLAYFGLTSWLCCPSSENHATLTGGMENKNQFNSYN